MSATLEGRRLVRHSHRQARLRLAPLTPPSHYARPRIARAREDSSSSPGPLWRSGILPPSRSDDAGTFSRAGLSSRIVPVPTPASASHHPCPHRPLWWAFRANDDHGAKGSLVRARDRCASFADTARDAGQKASAARSKNPPSIRPVRWRRKGTAAEAVTWYPRLRSSRSQFGARFWTARGFGSVPKLDVPDTLMQNLPGQPAEAMGYRPNRFVVS